MKWQGRTGTLVRVGIGALLGVLAESGILGGKLSAVLQGLAGLVVGPIP